MREAALLVSGHDLVRPEAAARLSPVRWARLTDGSPLDGCQAMGFPRAQHERTRGVDTEHIECALRPGSGLVRNRYVLDVKDVSPEPASGTSPRTPQPMRSGWSGGPDRRRKRRKPARSQAAAHRADTCHFSSSPRERAEAYSALVRDFADGTIDIAAYAAHRRRLNSTGGDTG
ncbi:hypothetical protein [Streptomyces sp. XH2]|uniref:hypothetical protein n=1 Tax=Streptomyces sp. XH2 TaxID=3412483 RepID=UPI003C7CC1FD